MSGPDEERFLGIVLADPTVRAVRELDPDTSGDAEDAVDDGGPLPWAHA